MTSGGYSIFIVIVIIISYSNFVIIIYFLYFVIFIDFTQILLSFEVAAIGLVFYQVLKKDPINLSF